ncbi:MAG: M90 family metallopeptidase [Pseudomonadales bacterium]
MTAFTLYSLVIAAIVASLVAGKFLRTYYRRARRERAYRKPFEREWEFILARRVPLYRRLPEDLRDALHQRINYFLLDKKIIGRGGQAIDDDVRVTIAGQACLLVMAEPGEIFPGFKTILVYPDTFFSDQHHVEHGVVTRHREHRAGESWHRGPVILSWGDVLRGGDDADDGFNVVLHEFAHKLDEQNFASNGQPLLRESHAYAEWVEVLSREYREFLERVERRSNSVLDAYGATSPPEFFAVATESFFEKPLAMREHLPDLYRQMLRFYQLDPASWRE